MSELKCPLCKSTTLSTEELSCAWGTGDFEDHVICDDCGCNAPVKSWNTRTSKWVSVDDIKLETFAYYWVKYHDGTVTGRPVEYILDRFSGSSWQMPVLRISHVIKLEAPKG